MQAGGTALRDGQQFVTGIVKKGAVLTLATSAESRAG